MLFPYKLIDLTHEVHEGIPCWEGGCGFRHEVVLDYDDCNSADKFRVMKQQMFAGVGTHLDAPSHCFRNALSIEALDINTLCMPCVVLDVSKHADERYLLGIEEIKAFESQFGRVPEGACVLVRTGWERFWYQPEKYRNNLVYPSVSGEAAAFLIDDRGVYGLGVDTLSPDCARNEFPVHRAFLGTGRVLLENVANLENMPCTGGFVMALPMKVRGATEAQVRLVGLVARV